MTVTTMAEPPTSVGWLCAGVRRMLSQNLNDELAFTADAYTNGQASISLKAIPRRVGPGSILSWHGNTFYVVSLSGSSAQVEVMNGYDGAPGQDMPSGVALRVNPRFTDHVLFEQVAAVIGSMSAPASGLFQAATLTVSGAQTDGYHLLPLGATRVLGVQARNGSQDWYRISEYTASFASDAPYVRIFVDALQYRITYATTLTVPTSFDDDAITDCGLTDTMLDIPVLGASAFLMQGQEARRVNQRAQGDPRRAEDTPITGSLGSARELYRLYRERVDEEYGRLLRSNPIQTREM